MSRSFGSAPRSSLYNYTWQKERAAFLLLNPFCIDCSVRDLVVKATIVDHKIPHKENLELFWDRDNWQPLCKPCHDRHKQRLEKSGRVVGCTIDGVPVDPNHHWARGFLENG